MRVATKQRSLGREGFSLIELLVVVTLIAFLSVGIGLALGSGNENTRIRAAETSLSGYIQFLRSKAILEGQPVRLLIADDDADPETYHRRIGGVVRSSSSPNQWLAIDKGIELSDGVYFWRDNSTVGLSQMQLTYPRRLPVTEGSGETWLFLEILSTGELSFDAGRLTLFADRPQPDELPEAGNDSVYGGFLLSRLAVTVFPQDPSALIQ